MTSAPSSMEIVSSDGPPKSHRKHYRQRPRGNNHKARSDDAFRKRVGERVIEDYRAARNAKFQSNLPSDLSQFNLRTPASFAQRPVTSVVKRVPFSTIGIGLAVSELLNRFFDSFRLSQCSVYALYRTSLAQLELHRQVSAEGGTSVYPMEQSLVVDIPSEFRNAAKAHPDNFKVITYIIETFGRFKFGPVEYVSTIPDVSSFEPFYVSFLSLQRTVTCLSDINTNVHERQAFFQHNALPGAIVDESRWLLMNPNDFWPANYSGFELRQDFISVVRMLENMKTKFEQVSDRLTYSGQGKISTLMSVRDPQVCVHYQRHIEEPFEQSSGKRRRADEAHPPRRAVYEPRPSRAPEQFWYSSEPMQALEASLGILSFSGCTTESLERSNEMMRVRNQYNSSVRVTEAWTSLFDEVVPRVSRS